MSGRDRPFAYPVRVYYEDTDAGGVVYHANYLRYFERGRSDFLRVAGVGHAELLADDQPLAFVAALRALLADWNHSRPNRRVPPAG